MMIQEVIRIINTTDCPAHIKQAGRRLLQAWLAYDNTPNRSTKLVFDRRLAWFERVFQGRKVAPK